MGIYLLNIALILLFGILLKNRKKLYCTVVAIQWILISGLRHVSVGADTMAYEKAFNTIKYTSWKSIFDQNIEYLTDFFGEHTFKDPGYIVFEKLCNIFTDNYQVFLIIIAIIFIGSMSVWIYKNSSIPYLSFILFSTLFYSFFAITGHRQTIATALVVFWGYKFIKERNLWKFIVVSFLAFMIHKSSAVFVPFYFLANVKIKPKYTIVAIIATMLVALFGKSLYGPIAELLGFSEGMINSSIGGAETYAAVLLIVCTIILLGCNDMYERRNDATKLYNATLITVLMAMFIFQNQSFMRVQLYYALFVMIVLPEFVLTFDKKTQPIVSILGSAVLIVYLIIQNPQYMFFWQG